MCRCVLSSAPILGIGPMRWAFQRTLLGESVRICALGDAVGPASRSATGARGLTTDKKVHLSKYDLDGPLLKLWRYSGWNIGVKCNSISQSNKEIYLIYT